MKDTLQSLKMLVIYLPNDTASKEEFLIFDFFALEIKVLQSTRTSETVYPMTQCNIPGDTKVLHNPLLQ
jgi:hypothetical protein